MCAFFRACIAWIVIYYLRGSLVVVTSVRWQLNLLGTPLTIHCIVLQLLLNFLLVKLVNLLINELLLFKKIKPIYWILYLILLFTIYRTLIDGIYFTIIACFLNCILLAVKYVALVLEDIFAHMSRIQVCILKWKRYELIWIFQVASNIFITSSTMQNNLRRVTLYNWRCH